MRLIFAALLLCILPLKAFSDEKAPFIICYENQHFPPFVLGATQEVPASGGVLIDYIRLAEEQLDQAVVFERLPWKRCQAEVQRGNIDALFATIYTDERDQWAAFPKTDNQPDQRYLYMARYPVFVPLSSTLTWDGQKFSTPYPQVQSVPGYVATLRLEAMGIKPMIPLQPKSALPMVASGRLDGFIVEELIGWSLVNELGLSAELQTLPIPFLEQPLYLAFSKQRYAEDNEAVERFWSALSTIRDKQGKQIQQRYREIMLSGQ